MWIEFLKSPGSGLHPGLALGVALLLSSAIGADEAKIYKVVCLRSPEGCPCVTAPGRDDQKIMLHHALAVSSTGEEIRGFRRVETGGKSCYYPSNRLIVMKSPGVLASPRQRMAHRFLLLNEFLENGERDLQGIRDGSVRFEPIGNFWPTYYHLALEELYPGRERDILDTDGRSIGRASDEFLRQVTWEGSGILNDGRHLRYSGRPDRYEFYERDIWGYGAGFDYTIYPYRTIAVNFPGLCRRLKKWIPDCSKKEAIGLVVKIEEVSNKKIGMDGDSIHDGLFCATDTGAPYFIREDRIDIFVGMHGGGNPYLPEQRRGNRMIEGGIINILPSEWRLWNGFNDRVWCETFRIPSDPFHPKKNECVYDYHAVAAAKSLRLYALFDASGRPVRCKKRLPFQ